jgi:hypothetical protein
MKLTGAACAACVLFVTLALNVAVAPESWSPD